MATFSSFVNSGKYCSRALELKDLPRHVRGGIVNTAMPGTCKWCDEPFLDGEPNLNGMHAECLKRGVFGSVGHQLGLCSCPGNPGTLDDPPGMSVREAARAAVRQAIAHIESSRKARWN